MVAITVILAAVIAAFVFGMAGTTATTKTVGTTMQLNKTSSDDFNLQFTGGADLPALNYFTVSYDGAIITPDAVSTSDAAGSNVAMDTAAGATTHVIPDGTLATKFSVGEIVFVSTNKGALTGHKITIIGGFNDGSTQILLDRTL